MANLITRKLSRLPIGTQVELTCGDGADHYEKVGGVIIDNDFSDSVALLTPSGEEIILNYAIIQGVSVVKNLESALGELPPGTRIRFSYGSEDNREPELSGTVLDNDFEQYLEIQTDRGEELTLQYALIRSLVIRPGPAGSAAASPSAPSVRPAPSAPEGRAAGVPAPRKAPEDTLNAGDPLIKQTFEQLPKEERKKLGGAFDSFQYGVKNNDREKTARAARQARQILLEGYDQGYAWSEGAVRLCGYLLRRNGLGDPEVFLAGGLFCEAALVCWQREDFLPAGVYAALALLQPEQGRLEDLDSILASAVERTGDASALRPLYDRLPAERSARLEPVIRGLLAGKGVQAAPGQGVSGALDALEALYPKGEMALELRPWLEEDGDDPSGVPKAAEEPQSAAPPRFLYGVISRLRWMERAGVITGDDGERYPFRYEDVSDAPLAKALSECLRADLGGREYFVKFRLEGGQAREVQSDANLVARARAIAADTGREDRGEAAFGLCKKAVDTPDARRALGDLVKYALYLYNAQQRTEPIGEALALYESHAALYPANAFALLDLAQCYFHVKKYPQMVEHGEKAVALPGLSAKQKIALLANYLRMLREYYQVSGDRALLARMLELIDGLRGSYAQDFSDPQLLNLYYSNLLQYRIQAECGLDQLEAAEADYALVSDSSAQKPLLDELIAKARARLAPRPEPEPEPAPGPEPAPEAESEPQGNSEPPAGWGAAGEADEEEAEEIPPYQDADGWAALKLSKGDVADYALGITGPGQIPALLAYLRAGAALNPALAPLYRSAALAANDPAEAPDYSAEALIGALSGGDPDYPEFNDCCMGAAFLRAAFQCGMAYDYSTKGLRDSISVCQRIPALSAAFDTLEEFHREAGRAIDIYADYRNSGVKRIQQELEETVRQAGELYTKYILTPAREDARLARLLEAKKIVFARDGELAALLRHVMERDQAALEEARERFFETYLGGAAQAAAARVSERAVDGLIAWSWEEAASQMQLRRGNSTLQGDRRNNLRSNITHILNTVLRWYALSEQSAGLTWRTEAGEAAYRRLRPQLMEQLSAVSAGCAAEGEQCGEPQRRSGLALLSAAARELGARLDGSWIFGQEKYLYADFLRGNWITLGEDFLPELSSTFCALPEFNVLARIRRHAEGPRRSFQEQIDLIYGHKACNNYGTAARIVEYLAACGGPETVTLPEQPERFVAQSQRQTEIQYRGFRETYALAVNYGQIIKTDTFCHTLEDTVKYWYAFCRESGNYGFFTSLLLQAENQIHASAQQYEQQLEEQLEALIESNQGCFQEHPDYAEAIRTQIANQNFTVAEDWMARIRIGDFSLNVQQPEALGYLAAFWNSYVETYSQVADASHTLSSLLGLREGRSRDRKRAQQLIDNWLLNGRHANPARIGQLLALLGWQNITVRQSPFSGELNTELYEVRREARTVGPAAPLHPVAAFGSALDRKPMYTACLYGANDCDRIIEKIRSLDSLDGSVLVLVDWALGQADRRALARKLKRRESGLRNVYLVIDRVLITFLANHYSDNLINRILMAVAMPFSYYQPYVVESVLTMPPEIFIGRKDELLKIEQPDGVNLIYGGRQLGKSALFKKALSDLDGCRGQRAVLVDIKELDCAAAARKVSTKLIDLGITPEGEITEDWDVLCRSIERRLRSAPEGEINYFLLMLDEADTFIDDCAGRGYRPLVALKDVQQSLPGRFKYVLAGLHNIVKFNRQVALGSNSVITHMPSLKITPFHTPEAQELLTGPLSYLGFSLPSKVTVSQILATCNYFPGLIQLYAKKLIGSVRAADYAGYDESKTPPYVVSDEHLRRVMSDKEFVDQIHEKFEITLTLDQDQGSCYYPLTLLIGWMYNDAPSKSGYTAGDVLRCARELSIHPISELDEEKVGALLLELQDLNILRSVSNSSFLLASKNFRDLLGTEEEILDKLVKVGGAG